MEEGPRGRVLALHSVIRPELSFLAGARREQPHAGLPTTEGTRSPTAPACGELLLQHRKRH